jgi:hypothetical protein
MSRHLFRASPAPDTPPGMVVAEEQARWWSFFRVDVIAVEDWYAEDYRVFRRSRELFRKVLLRALKSAHRLYRDYDRIGSEWRASFDRVTSETFWHEYLNLDREDSADARRRHAA